MINIVLNEEEIKEAIADYINNGAYPFNVDTDIKAKDIILQTIKTDIVDKDKVAIQAVFHPLPKYKGSVV